MLNPQQFTSTDFDISNAYQENNGKRSLNIESKFQVNKNSLKHNVAQLYAIEVLLKINP